MEGFWLQKDFNFFYLKGSALEGAGKMRTEGGGNKRCPSANGIFERRVNHLCGGATRVQGFLLPLCVREEQVRDPRLVAHCLNVWGCCIWGMEYFHLRIKTWVLASELFFQDEWKNGFTGNVIGKVNAFQVALSGSSGAFSTRAWKPMVCIFAFLGFERRNPWLKILKTRFFKWLWRRASSNSILFAVLVMQFSAPYQNIGCLLNCMAYESTGSLEALQGNKCKKTHGVVDSRMQLSRFLDLF